MGHAELASFLMVFVATSAFAAFFIPTIAFAEEANETNNTTSQNVGISGYASILSLSPSVSELAIASGPQISIIDPVRIKVGLMNSFGSSWAGGLTDVFDSYNITYTIKLQYCFAFAFWVCVWWSDFSPVKEKSYSNIVYAIKALTSAKLVVSKPDGYQVDYNYDHLNTQSTEAAENWAENLMNNLDGVAVGYLGTQDSGKTLALTVTAKGYAENNGQSVSYYNWNIMANSANNPLVVTVTNPPDPDIKYSGSRQYRLDGTWYSFSTPIKLKPGQSRNLDFYVTNIGCASSGDGFVSMSISGNLDLADMGSASYNSDAYPPGSQLSGKCSVPNSQYKLLDTWALYAAGQSRTIYTRLVGKDYGEGWIKIRAAFDTPANGMNTVVDPRDGESSEQDQQCFPAYKIPVTVGECFADSDCPSDGWVGSTYCQDNDIWQTWRDYFCAPGNTCSYLDSGNAKQDCGIDYDDPWGAPFCETNSWYHTTTHHSKGCEAGACYDRTTTKKELISTCQEEVQYSQPYCSMSEDGSDDIWRQKETGSRSCQYSNYPACTTRWSESYEKYQECGNNSYGAWTYYCKGNDQWKKRPNNMRGCENNTCFDRTQTEDVFVQLCPFGCYYGVCAACSNDSDCNGGTWIEEPEWPNCCTDIGGGLACYSTCTACQIWQKKNVCLYAGTSSAQCSVGYRMKQQCSGSNPYCQNAQCFQHCNSYSDCGISGFAGDSYCSNDFSMRTYVNYSCVHPGSYNSYCLKSSWEESAEYCPYGCSNGKCNTPNCTNVCSSNETSCNGNIKQTCGDYNNDSCFEWGGDFDCGTSYCENWSVNYCKSGDVYQNRICYSRGCSSGACYDTASMEEQWVQICPNGCFGGACNSSSLSGDANGDCKVDIFDLAAVGLAFGSQPGDANWNPNADFTGNGKIDIFDLATVGLNYGKSL